MGVILNNMKIEDYLKQNKIKKFDFGKELGYTTKAGIYAALKNEKQKPLLKAYLLVKLLSARGVDIENILKELK